MGLTYKDLESDGKTIDKVVPIDAATRSLVETLGAELGAIRDRAKARAARGEEIRWDALTRMVTWESRRGEVIGRWYGEVIATYVLRDRILKWSWAGKSTASHAEVISRAGGDRSVRQLAQSLVADLDEPEALELAELGIVLARGQGMLVVRGTFELELVGLFDSARPRDDAKVGYSVPPPQVAHSNPPGRPSPPQVAAHSSPPGRPSFPPGHIREPPRALFVPVANAVLARLAKAASGYKQALFVIRPEPLTVSLTVLDGEDLLRSIEAPPAVLDAAARMVAADRADGNGPWRKLSARILPKPDGGATLTVDITP